MTTKKTDPNQITFDNPIIRGEDDKAQKIESVTLRRPKAGELRGLNLTDVATADVDAMTTLIPRITTPPLTEQEVRGLDIADMAALAGKVRSFLEQKSDSQ